MVRKRRSGGRKRDEQRLLCFGGSDEIYDGRLVNELVEKRNAELEKQETGYLYVIFINAFFMRMYSFQYVREKMLLFGNSRGRYLSSFGFVFPTR